MTHRSVVVFCKAPRAGTVKTRLAAILGDQAALEAYRLMAGVVLTNLAELERCDVVAAFTPADARAEVAAWLGGAPRLVAQQGADLGARMAHAVRERIAEGAEAVVVIGTDCPAVDAARLEAAFAALHGADVVLGPAADGGYYLIGMRAPHEGLFEEVPWSSPETLARTLDRARALGLSVALLPEETDIDDAAAWTAWLRSRP